MEWTVVIVDGQKRTTTRETYPSRAKAAQAVNNIKGFKVKNPDERTYTVMVGGKE